MRVLHVNKFLYRRGGAEGYLLDLADLQRVAGDTVAYFGMSHPENESPLPYAARFPSEWSWSRRRRGAAPRGGRRPDAVVTDEPPRAGPGDRRLPAGRAAPAQHLPPALPVGARRRPAPPVCRAC